MNSRVDIPALIGSRICHDLISPLGAIGNGVELLGLTGIAESPEMALIAESVANANARIRFFRVAFGVASDGQGMSRSEIAGTLGAVARGGRLSYVWEPDGDQPRTDVRIAFLLLLCMETAMPLGGHIDVRQIGAVWEIIADGRRITIDDVLWDSLTNPRARPEISPAQVQFALLPEVLRQTKRSLGLVLGPDRIVARF